MADIEMIFVDSLIANEFSVEIEGETASGVLRVLGFTPYNLDPDAPRVVVVTKMVQRDGNLPFNKWLRDAETKGSQATRELALVAVDDGIETRRWTLKGAYIQSVRYTDFDTGSTELVEEMLTIVYESIAHTWSATEALK